MLSSPHPGYPELEPEDPELLVVPLELAVLVVIPLERPVVAVVPLDVWLVPVLEIEPPVVAEPEAEPLDVAPALVVWLEAETVPEFEMVFEFDAPLLASVADEDAERPLEDTVGAPELADEEVVTLVPEQPHKDATRHAMAPQIRFDVMDPSAGCASE